MGRLIVLALAVAGIVWWVRRSSARGDDAERMPRPREDAGEPVQPLVRCAQCGVHLPGAEAREHDGRSYCSDEHARLGPGSGPK